MVGIDESEVWLDWGGFDLSDRVRVALLWNDVLGREIGDFCG